MIDAIKFEMDRRAQANTLNKMVMESLPEDPERGSYHWWAKLCRQNTGQHFLDSGVVLGYTYNAPVADEERDPVAVRFRDGDLEYLSISTIHFLHNLLDAADETAEALEKLLYWCGLWLHPREAWHDVIKEFDNDLRQMFSFVSRFWRNGTKVDRFDRKRYCKQVVFRARIHMKEYDIQRFQRKLSASEYVQQAADEFPTDDFKKLREACVARVLTGGYTYNNENDLNQDFVYVPIGGEGSIFAEEYVIIRTHNGADARGGFSDPVVAAFRDVGYFYSFEVDLWCRECDTNWSSSYWYHQELETRPDALFDLDALQTCLDIYDKIEAGQMEMTPGWQWPFKISPQAAKHILEYKDDITMPPPATFQEWPVWEGAFPGIGTALLCPKCGAYAVCIGNPVYGF